MVNLKKILNTNLNDSGPPNIVILGVPLGYIASYFFQPGFYRLLVGISDYVTSCKSILLAQTADNSPPGPLQDSMAKTAWIGIVVGLVVASSLQELFHHRKPDSPKTTDKES